MDWALDGLHEDLNKVEKKLYRKVCVAIVSPGLFADGHGSHWHKVIFHTSQHLLVWKLLWSAVLTDDGTKVWLPFLAPGDVMPICCSIVVPMPVSGGFQDAWLATFSISVKHQTKSGVVRGQAVVILASSADAQEFLGWKLNDLLEDLNKAENNLYRNFCVASVNSGLFADRYGSQWFTCTSHSS